MDDITKDKLREKGIEFEPELLQQKDENGKYTYETICKTFIEISEDPNVIKLGNYKLTKDEMDEINEAIEDADLLEMGIR